eukprot:4961815-Amphidinium_carterae.1
MADFDSTALIHQGVPRRAIAVVASVHDFDYEKSQAFAKTFPVTFHNLSSNLHKQTSGLNITHTHPPPQCPKTAKREMM